MSFEDLMNQREVIALKKEELNKKMDFYYEKDSLSYDEWGELEKLSEEYKQLNKEDSLLVEMLIETFKKN